VGRADFRGGKRRIFPVHYDPSKKLFHILVKLSDAPGSYSLILDLIRTKVNLIGTTTYTSSDGTAMFSGFSEALSPDLTGDGLKKLIMHSKAAIAAEIHEGKDGLLVDTFHTGYIVGTDEYILMRREGLIHVFDRVARMLGSGGDALLYDEGMTMGLKNSEIMIKRIGLDNVRNQTGVLNRFLAAQGWGQVKAKGAVSDDRFTLEVSDCFECSDDRGFRKGCHFIRGYLAGGAKATYGRDFESKETKCILKGDDVCEFRLKSQ